MTCKEITGGIAALIVTLGIVAFLMLLTAPLLLIFTEGEDGAPTIWNFVGLAYLALLIFAAYKAKRFK